MGAMKRTGLSEVHPEVLDERSFLTQQRKKDHFAASRRRWLESQGKKARQQESWQNEWHDMKYQGEMANAPPCPERTLKTPMPQQSSPSSGDEESQWVAVDDRRKRRVAVEETARSDGRSRYLHQASPAGKKRERPFFLKFPGKGKKMFALPAWPDGTRQ